MSANMNHSSRRGSALLIALIAIGVLMVLVVAAIQFTGTNREGAVAKLRADELAACAESAKRLVFNQIGTASTSLHGSTFRFELPDRVTASERTVIVSGHYGDADGGAILEQVAASVIGSNNRGARDLANSLPMSASSGGLPYKTMVTCRDRVGREAEVEFLFRFGF